MNFLRWDSFLAILLWHLRRIAVLVRVVEPLRLSGWWLTYPFWKIWVRQWEGLSHILWKIKFMFETTNQLWMPSLFHIHWVKFFFSRFLLMTFFNILHLLAQATFVVFGWNVFTRHGRMWPSTQKKNDAWNGFNDVAINRTAGQDQCKSWQQPLVQQMSGSRFKNHPATCQS